MVAVTTFERLSVREADSDSIVRQAPACAGAMCVTVGGRRREREREIVRVGPGGRSAWVCAESPAAGSRRQIVR